MRFAAMILCALLFCFGSFAADAPWMGVNLESARDWEPNNMFADAMKQSRPWGNAATPWDQAYADVDANGWPNGDAGVVVKSNAIYLDIGGTYKLSFNGHANVAGVSSALTIQNKVYDAASNTTTCDVVVAPTNTQINLAFTGTTGGVKNVKLMRPGYSTETFTREFTTLLQPFSCLRSVWLSQVIGSPVVNWSDRTLPTYATMNRRVGVGNYTSPFYGCAWEYIIQLSNETNKDLWINIPDQATGDYVTQLATLLMNTANPNLHIYVEWSNEVWNGQYAETARNQAAANAEVAAGNSPLNYDGETNAGYLAWRRVGMRTKEISDIFRSVFGGAQMMTRVRPVLCMQNGYTMTIRQPLQFLEGYYGAPSNYVYAIACAPYFGIPTSWNSRTDLTVDDIIGAMNTSLPATLTQAKDFSTFAHWYNIKFMTYEGGPSITGAPSLTAKIQSATDPRMNGIVHSFCDQFNQIGGDWLNYYTSISGNGQFGTFGLTDDVNNLNTPKYQAVLQALAVPRAAVTAGTTLPGTIPAGNFDLQSGFAAPGTPTVNISQNVWFEYLIRVPATATYTLNPSVASAGGQQLQALVNGAAIASWNIPNTGGINTFVALPQVNVQLNAGLQVIRMNGLSGAGISLQSITFGALPSIVPSAQSVSLAPGASASFSVSLSQAPLANVTVNAAWLSGDADISVTGGAALTFTPSNWNVAQIVTLAAAANANAVSGSAAIQLSASGYPSVTVAATDTVVNPLVFTSMPSVSPSNVMAGSPATFTAAASGNGAVSMTWNFGDGSASASGASMSHTYAAAGTFTLTCTAMDSASQQAAASLSVVVNAASTGGSGGGGSGNGAGSSGGAGSGSGGSGSGGSDSGGGVVNNPPAPTAPPVDGVPGQSGAPVPQPQPQALPLTVTKLQCRMLFSASNKNSSSFTFTIPSLPNGFTPQGQSVSISIGDASASFTLDSKGHAQNSTGTLIFKFKQAQKVILTNAPVTVSGKLANSNATFVTVDPAANAKNMQMPVNVTLTVAGSEYAATVNGKYSATAGKSGALKN